MIDQHQHARPRTPRILIIAGNFEQARTAARERGLAPNDWTYISGEQAMRGKLPGSPFILVGTYGTKRDIHLIKAEIARRGHYAWAAAERDRG